MRRWAVAGWAAFAAVGCEEPRTELVVRVDSELAWGPGQVVQAISLTVRRGGHDGPLRSARTTALGDAPGRAALPLLVGLLPGDDVDTPVWVEALGCGTPDGCTPADARVAQRALVRFTPGQTLELPLLLASACLDVECSGGERCSSNGRCETATVAQLTVRPFLGIDRRDAATTPDGAGGDVVPMDLGVADAATADTADRPSPVSDAADVPTVDASDAPGVDATFDVGDVTAREDVPTADDVGTRDVAMPPPDTTSPDASVAPVDVDPPMDVPRDVPLDAPDAPALMCPAGLADCDRSPANGCEVTLATDTSHCGGCGLACSAGVRCGAGICGDPPPPLRWARRYGSTASTPTSSVTGLARDASGNLYFVGFAPHGTTFGSIATGEDLGFLASLTSDGGYRWSTTIYAGGPTSGPLLDVVVDRAGNVVVVGGADSIHATRTPPTPGRLWSTTFRSGTNYRLSNVAVDASGNLLALGSTAVMTTLGSSSLTPGTFLVSLTPEGTVRWARTVVAGASSQGDDLAIDSTGNVYVAGHFSETVDLGDGAVTSTFGYDDGFVLALAGDGTFRWKRLLDSPRGDELSALLVDASGDVVVAGVTSGSAWLGSGVAAGGILAALSPSGTLRWARSFAAGESSVEVGALARSPTGDLYLCGRFSVTGTRNTVNLGGGPLPEYSRTPFLASYRGNGDYRWGRTFDGNNTLSTTSTFADLVVPATDSVFVTGRLFGTVDLGGGPIARVGMGTHEPFVAHFAR